MFFERNETNNPPFRRASGGTASRSLIIDNNRWVSRDVGARGGRCELRGLRRLMRRDELPRRVCWSSED